MSEGKLLSEYHPNGSLRTRSYWSDRQNGVVQGYTENGQQEYEIVIRDGIRVLRRTWDDFGKEYIQYSDAVVA